MVLRPPLVAGSWFHSLHATSHALHPIHTVVSVKNPIGSAITLPPSERERLPTASRFLHVADEGFAFMDRDVGIADERGELIHHVAGADAFPAPVPRHTDLMHDPAVDRERPQPPRHQRLGAHLRAWRADPHPVEIANTLL